MNPHRTCSKTRNMFRKQKYVKGFENFAMGCFFEREHLRCAESHRTLIVLILVLHKRRIGSICRASVSTTLKKVCVDSKSFHNLLRLVKHTLSQGSKSCCAIPKLQSMISTITNAAKPKQVWKPFQKPRHVSKIVLLGEPSLPVDRLKSCARGSESSLYLDILCLSRNPERRTHSCITSAAKCLVPSSADFPYPRPCES